MQITNLTNPGIFYANQVNADHFRNKGVLCLSCSSLNSLQPRLLVMLMTYTKLMKLEMMRC